MKKIISKYLFSFIIIISALAIFYFSNNKTNDTENKNIPKLETNSKIISLSPSITRQIISLKKENMLAGVTSFHPPLKNKIPEIGNLINPNSELILKINPDIILYSKEDTSTLKIEQLQNSSLKAYAFKRNLNFKSISENYIILGTITGNPQKAQDNISILKKQLILLKNKNANKNIRTAFFLSNEPLISVGGESYICSIIKDSGGELITQSISKSPYPIISKEFLFKSKTEIIISTSEGSEIFFKNLYRSAGLTPPVIISIPPDNICYYTPQDYLLSVRLISDILENIR